MNLFEDMTLLEMAELAYAILSDNVALSQTEMADFQRQFSSRIAQCEHLETLKSRDFRDPPHSNF